MNSTVTGHDLITFDRLSDLYVENRSFNPPAELHGLLCGQFCAGIQLGHQQWLRIAAEQMAVKKLNEHAEMVLGMLYDQILDQLQDEDLTFQVLLPDDDESIIMRTEAIGQWCQGFLSGYAMGGLREGDVSEEATAVLMDMTQIARVQADELEESNDSEKDFLEVNEYLRMAALMLFTEVTGSGDSETQPPSDEYLH